MAVFDSLFKPNIEKLKKKRDVDGLIKALTYKKWAIRRDAARALGELADERAEKSLITALEDGNREVVRQAENALIKIMPPEEARRLAQEAEEKRLAREAEEKRLAREAEVNRLIPYLGSQDRTRQFPAAVALAELGDTRGVEFLIAVLNDPIGWHDDNFQKAILTLAEVKDSRVVEPIVRRLGSSSDAVRDAAMEATVKLGNIAVEQLTKTLFRSHKSDYGEIFCNRIRSGSAEALGRIGDLRAVEPLIQVLKSRGYWLYGEEENTVVSKAAKEALLKLGEEADLEPLVIELQDPDKYVSEPAARVLNELGWQPTDANQRGLYAFLLGQWDKAATEGGEAVERLVEIFEGKNHQYTDRESAAEALGKIGDTRGLPWLVGKVKQLPCDESALYALTRVVQANALGIPSEILQTIAELRATKIVYHSFRNPMTDETESEEEYIEVDCSRVRELARQELIRRGLEKD